MAAVFFHLRLTVESKPEEKSALEELTRVLRPGAQHENPPGIAPNRTTRDLAGDSLRRMKP
jgi:hypothetical protein